MPNMISLGQAEPVTYPPVNQVYDEMRDLCQSKLPLETCNGILPARYLYYPPEERPQVPAWVWIVAGVVIGRLFYAQ